MSARDSSECRQRVERTSRIQRPKQRGLAISEPLAFTGAFLQRSLDPDHLFAELAFTVTNNRLMKSANLVEPTTHFMVEDHVKLFEGRLQITIVGFIHISGRLPHILKVPPVDIVCGAQRTDLLIDLVGIAAHILVFGHDPEFVDLRLELIDPLFDGTDLTT
jgi:hypothetical protein